MNIKKKLMVIIPVILLVIGLGAFTILPANSLTMDVNPSIEIETNRLNRVVSIRPLNLDAEQLLKEFNPKSKKLEDVVSDLVDLMILTGHIKGGDDNIVMISVKDESVDSELLRKVNTAIKSFLENKQIEATILNQSIAKSEEKEFISSGKEVVAEKISTLGGELSINQLSNMTLKELIKYSKDNNIDTQELFRVAVGNLDAFAGKVKELEKGHDHNKKAEVNNEQANKGQVNKVQGNQGKISKDQARKIALDLVNGSIIEFDEDDDEYEIEIIKDGIEYEIEIDAYSGKVLEFERDDDDNKKVQVNKVQANKVKISKDQAKKIALDLVNGTIIEFDEDDDEYEIEIIKDGIEYEIEIDAYSGKILEFEKDD